MRHHGCAANEDVKIKGRRTNHVIDYDKARRGYFSDQVLHKIPKKEDAKLKAFGMRVTGVLKAKKQGFGKNVLAEAGAKTTNAEPDEAERKLQEVKEKKKLLTSDLLSRSPTYRVAMERLHNCQLLKSLVCLRQPLDKMDKEASLVPSSVEAVTFDPYPQSLRPHCRGLGQQSGYGADGSGKTAHEYVGLLTTLSQLKKNWMNR